MRPGNIPSKTPLEEIHGRIRDLRNKTRKVNLPSSPIVGLFDDIGLLLGMLNVVIDLQERRITALEKRCYRLENPDAR